MSNYTLNVDEFCGLTKRKNYRPTILQKAFDQIHMISAARSKFYPF